MFEEDDFDIYLYLLGVGSGILAYIYFALLKQDFVNLIFVGFYILMFFATYTSVKVQKRIEEEGE